MARYGRRRIEHVFAQRFVRRIAQVDAFSNSGAASLRGAKTVRLALDALA